MLFSKKIETRGIPELDTLRFVAVTLVLGHHLFYKSDPFFRWLELHGYVGVDLFFTLSGFIITLGLRKEWNRNNTINLKRFWVRRMLRLWPSLIVTLLISTGIVYSFASRNSELMTSLIDKWWHYYLHFGNYSYVYFGKLHRLFGHYWSLAVEEHFYLIWPICFFALMKIKKSTYFIFPLLLILPYLFRVYNTFQGYPNVYNTFQTHTRFDALAFGCLLAFVWDRIPHYKSLSLDVIIWLLGVIILQIGLDLKFYEGSPWLSQCAHSVRSLAALLFIYALIKGPVNGVRKLWANKWLSRLGILSYGVYLTHFIGNTLLFKGLSVLNVEVNHYLVFLASNIIAYIMAYYLYIYIDLPFVKIKNRFQA